MAETAGLFDGLVALMLDSVPPELIALWQIYGGCAVFTRNYTRPDLVLTNSGWDCSKPRVGGVVPARWLYDCLVHADLLPFAPYIHYQCPIVSAPELQCLLAKILKRVQVRQPGVQSMAPPKRDHVREDKTRQAQLECCEVMVSSVTCVEGITIYNIVPRELSAGEITK